MSVKKISFFCLYIVCCFNIAVAAAQPNIVKIQKWMTSNGSEVLYVYEKELPIVDIQVVFDAGSARDADKPGLAKLTIEALNSGTQKKNADQVATAFDDVGAMYSSAVNRDMAVVALRSLSDPKFFNPAFETFTEVLSTPTFPQAEYLRIQKQMLNTLNQQDESPSSIASKAFYNAVFNDTPYGHPISGNIASVTRMQVGDLQAFYKNNYTANNAIIAIVGAVDQTQAKALAEKLSSRLGAGQANQALVENSLPQKQVFKHIAFPSLQTHVMIGQTGITRKDPAYFSAMVGNYILGGGSLTSRLFDEVREKRGLAYNVRSQFSALKEKGPFYIELQTRNSEAQNAINVVNQTLSDFVTKGPSAKEMVAAKQNLTQGFILRLASNSAIIGQLINIGYYQLPLNYLDTYQDNIRKVTDTDVKTCFQKLIRPNDLVTVTVGS